MRTLDPTLSSAMDTGNYDPYFLATIQDNYNGNVILTGAADQLRTQRLGISDHSADAGFSGFAFLSHFDCLSRGALICRHTYTVSTSNFCIINSTWDGNFQTFKCHLIPRLHYSAPGDQTYKQVIDTFCLAFGKTAVYLDPAAAWLRINSCRTGKRSS